MNLKLKKYYNKGCQYCPALHGLYILADIPTQYFIHCGLSATQITHLSFLSAILSLAFFFYDLKFLYMLFVLLSILFDVSDGMVARATNSGSSFGAFYDHFSDKIKISLYFLLFGIVYNDSAIWILTYLNLALFFLITSLNFIELTGKEAESSNTNSSTLQSVPNPNLELKKNYIVSISKGIYRSLFMMYANFMLWFIPVVLNKSIAVISLLIMIIIQVKNFSELFYIRYRFFRK